LEGLADASAVDDTEGVAAASAAAGTVASVAVDIAAEPAVADIVVDGTVAAEAPVAEVAEAEVAAGVLLRQRRGYNSDILPSPASECRIVNKMP